LFTDCCHCCPIPPHHTALTWTKRYKESLLAAECEVVLDAEKQKDEKNKAYDLLDALTKSGMRLLDALY
jgi:hypothetical protein